MEYIEINNDKYDIMHEGMKRPEMLLGSTYKIKTPSSDHALYITINDVILNEGTKYEERRPYEIFINSNNILYINNIRPTNPNGTIKIDNLEFTNFNIINNNIKSSINIDNDVIYRIPSISIKRFVNDCNILDVVDVCPAGR